MSSFEILSMPPHMIRKMRILKLIKYLVCKARKWIFKNEVHTLCAESDLICNSELWTIEIGTFDYYNFLVILMLFASL